MVLFSSSSSTDPLQTLTSCRSKSSLANRPVSNSACKVDYVRTNSRSGRENTPPSHLNAQIYRHSSTSVHKKGLKQREVPIVEENFAIDGYKDGSVPPSHDLVKVIVRIRPGQDIGGPQIFRSLNSDSLSVGSKTYSFDSILDPGCSQEDAFNLIGAPLVKNALAGFNCSIVSYGQSGAGKSYTMWGPTSSMVEDPAINSFQGIVPRIFRMLFSEICKTSKQKEESSKEGQTTYQCRCSFLEIYNDQINDLLEPTNRSLLDAARHSFQVENLNEEYVDTFEDVAQLLVKGLSNRKVGAISINSKSSRSHIIFTCVIESWCKSLSSNFITSSKTSKINFVDLAGKANKHDGIQRPTFQDDYFIKNSLLKFGQLVSTLLDSVHVERDKKIPLVKCCLTNVLQDIVGGNVKVTFICAIFPDERFKKITLSTLRFGGRAKRMRNKATINEISEHDVNGLSDQIRQLKEELIRAKSFGSSSLINNTDGYFNKQSARESLNILRWSLNRSFFFSSTNNDSETDNVNEEDAKKLCTQLTDLCASAEDGIPVGSHVIPNSSATHQKLAFCSSPVNNELSKVPELEKLTTLNVMVEEPALCASPKVDNCLMKSTFGLHTLKMASENPEHDSEKKSASKVDPILLSLQSSRKAGPIESLAASLHRGLQIIDHHQQTSVSNKSHGTFSFEHFPRVSNRSGIKKVDACDQILLEDVDTSLLCPACKKQVTLSFLDKPIADPEQPEKLRKLDFEVAFL